MNILQGKTAKSTFARRSAVTAVAAASVPAGLSGTAHAATPDMSCYGYTTTGAAGYLEVSTSQNLGADDTWNVHLEITDSLADGHHAQARPVAEDATGATRYWAWHSDTSGAGTVVVDTTAHDSAHGIIRLGIETDRAEGSTVLNSCTDRG
jgi:hypothetical protein